MDPIPEIVARYVAAYNNRDVDAIMACLTEDVCFINRSQGTETVRTDGSLAFRGLAEQGIAAFSSRRQTITNCIAAADHVSLRIDYRATVAVDLPNGWTAGTTIELLGVSLFRLRDGRIAELTDIA